MGSTGVVNQKYQSDPQKYTYWMGKGWPAPESLEIAYVEAINEAVKNGTFKPRNKNVALWGEDTDWGRAVAGALQKGFTASGWTIVNEQFVPNGETDLYPVLTKMKNSDASVVAGTSTAAATIEGFVKQSAEVKVNALLVCDGLAWIGDWYKNTGSASDGVLDCEPIFQDNAATNTFISTFQSKYNIVPSAPAAGQEYDEIRFFVQILQGAYKQYGTLNSQNIYQFAKDNVFSGKMTYDGGLIQKEYKWTPQSMPDPVVAEGEYMFPVLQYEGGKGIIIWPDYEKVADLKPPAGM